MLKLYASFEPWNLILGVCLDDGCWSSLSQPQIPISLTRARLGCLNQTSSTHTPTYITFTNYYCKLKVMHLTRSISLRQLIYAIWWMLLSKESLHRVTACMGAKLQGKVLSSTVFCSLKMGSCWLCVAVASPSNRKRDSPCHSMGFDSSMNPTSPYYNPRGRDSEKSS